MNVLIPLNEYFVDFEVGSGQPFSPLDQLVMRAIADSGQVSLEALESLFRLPKRVLVESMAGLARAGWVGMPATQQLFALTLQGERAVAEKSLPPALQIREGSCSVVMERASGKLVASSEVKFRPRMALVDEGIWESARRITPIDVDGAIDEAQVEKFLPKRKGEWVRWISKPLLKQQPWLVVSVDANTGRISELPEAFEHLRDEIGKVMPAPTMRTASTFEGLADLRGLVVRQSRSENRRFTELADCIVEPQDTLMTNAAHAAELESALGTAKRSILIASAFVDAAVIRGEVASWIEQALRRGCNVEVLWGYAADNDALEHLKVLARSIPGPGKLRFNADASGSHAKVLLYDLEQGYRAVVGSYNWLSVDPARSKLDSRPLRNISIRTSRSDTVGDLCRAMSALWSETGGLSVLSDVPNRWGGLAAELAREAVVKGPNAGTPTKAAEVVRDREHEHVMRDLILSAEHRCAIMSHQLGAKAQVRLSSFEAAGKIHERPIVIYGESESEFARQVEDVLRGSRAILHHGPDFHSKLIVADDLVLVSSYNLLSADPFGASRRSKEVGVLTHSKALADRLWTALGDLAGP